MAIQSKYAEMSKDALIAAIKARKAAGRTIKVDLRAAESVLAAALDADDMNSGEFDPAAKPPTDAQKPSATPPDKKNPSIAPPADKTAPLPMVSARDAALPDALRNQVAALPEMVSQPTQPSDKEFAGGSLARHKGDGLLYQVVKREADEFNRPIKARVPAQASGHPGFYWEGTAEEFAALFEKA